MIFKKHVNDGKLILAICDDSILGKKFEEDEKILDLSSDFYKGDKTDKEHLRELLKKAYVINAVGVNTIEFLIEEEIISKSNTNTISSIPYAQILLEEKKS